MPIARGMIGSKSINKELAKGPVLPTYTVAQLTGDMAAAKHLNRIIVVSNGNAGARTLAVSDGTNWVKLTPVNNVSAT